MNAKQRRKAQRTRTVVITAVDHDAGTIALTSLAGTKPEQRIARAAAFPGSIWSGVEIPVSSWPITEELIRSAIRIAERRAE